MKIGLDQAAYTIVEVLIVIAVTGALVMSVMYIISGQQGKTEFTQAINDIQAQINDVINNVSTGYYANNGNVSCVEGVSGPAFNTTSQAQGTNQACVFLGRGMQFAVNDDANSYNIYDIAGLRTSAGKLTQNLSEAKPKAIAPQNPNGADTTLRQDLQYGLEAAKMHYTDGTGPHNTNTITFMSTALASYSGSNLASGTYQIELIAVNSDIDISGGGDKSEDAAVAAIDYSNLVKANSVVICFNSGSSNQNGIITIGSNGRQLNTTLTISSGSCS